MAEEIRHPDGRIEHPSVRHEPTDASFRWILGVVVAAVVLAILIYGVVLAFFNHTRDTLAQTRKSRFPLAAQPSLALPREPRLEQLDRLAKDSPNFYLRQKARLDRLGSFGTTEEEGFVHIPIDRAMKLLAGKLPARGTAEPAQALAAAEALCFLSGPSGHSSLVATAALLAGMSALDWANLQRHDNGLVNGGASNSGRLFNRRTPRWYGP